MKTEAIVAAAGQGRRLALSTQTEAGLKKPYLKIKDTPILVLTLRALASSEKISGIIVVVDGRDIDMCRRMVKKYGVKRIKAVIRGGPSRTISVKNGLQTLDKDTGIVLIHDGVRPFINRDIIDASIKAAARHGACVVGVPVKATIKKLKRQKAKGKSVEKTLDRKYIWEIQTPQAFRRELVVQAYERYGGADATDDAALVEKMGREVKVVMGSYANIKITTPEDLAVAEAIYLRDRRG